MDAGSEHVSAAKGQAGDLEVTDSGAVVVVCPFPPCSIHHEQFTSSCIITVLYVTMADKQTMTITVMYQTSDTYVYIIIYCSSFKGGLHRACHTPTSVQSGEMEAGSIQLRLDYGFGGYWILSCCLPIQCHLVSCHIMHSFQPCVSNRIIVL